MKIKDLINKLFTLDREMTVCIDVDSFNIRRGEEIHIRSYADVLIPEMLKVRSIKNVEDKDKKFLLIQNAEPDD